MLTHAVQCTRKHGETPQALGLGDALPEFIAAHANWRAARLEPTPGPPQFEAMPLRCISRRH